MHEFPIVFSSNGIPLVGTFFRNSDSLVTRQPCVIVTGSWLNVKEQMATTYARALAERGYTTLVYDFAGWGESGGALRHVEMPTAKAHDIGAAVDIARSMSFVGPKIGYLGVCASAQYTLRALAAGAAIDAFVSVAGWFHDARSVAPFYDGDAGVGRRLARARAALAEYRKNGTLRMVPAYAPGDERAGMAFEMDYYGNPKRGAVSTWKNEMAELSWLHWLAFDGLGSASSVSTPTLFVHSDGCALPENVKAVHAALGGEKQLAWMEKGTQTDYYDLPEYVNLALERASAWFDTKLGGGVSQ
jgi:uncharacterized protein